MQQQNLAIRKLPAIALCRSLNLQAQCKIIVFLNGCKQVKIETLNGHCPVLSFQFQTCAFSHIWIRYISAMFFFFISPLFLYFSFSVLFIPPLHHFLPSFDSSIFLLLRSLKVRKELNNASMYFSLPFSLTCLL